MDLNHDKQIQSLLCYRYTIGQDGQIRLENFMSESRIVKMLNRCIVTLGLCEWTPVQRFNGSTIQRN
jgi:hypothetical protein